MFSHNDSNKLEFNIGEDIYNEKITNSSTIITYLIDITKNLLRKTGYTNNEGDNGKTLSIYLCIYVCLYLSIYSSIYLLNNDRIFFLFRK
jgi:hypothetical protein